MGDTGGSKTVHQQMRGGREPGEKGIKTMRGREPGRDLRKKKKGENGPDKNVGRKSTKGGPKQKGEKTIRHVNLHEHGGRKRERKEGDGWEKCRAEMRFFFGG